MESNLKDYFNSIREAVGSVLTKNPELNTSGKGREVLVEMQKIYPNCNPDTILRAYRQLRSPKDKDFIAEGNWREYFKQNAGN